MRLWTALHTSAQRLPNREHFLTGAPPGPALGLDLNAAPTLGHGRGLIRPGADTSLTGCHALKAYWQRVMFYLFSG
ncbi:MAG: hypothetical protein ACYC8T_01530, partial [Myxococcaceae bacterium]